MMRFLEDVDVASPVPALDQLAQIVWARVVSWQSWVECTQMGVLVDVWCVLAWFVTMQPL